VVLCATVLCGIELHCGVVCDCVLCNKQLTNTTGVIHIKTVFLFVVLEQPANATYRFALIQLELFTKTKLYLARMSTDDLRNSCMKTSKRWTG
jgi:hypothetical protein